MIKNSIVLAICLCPYQSVLADIEYSYTLNNFNEDTGVQVYKNIPEPPEPIPPTSLDKDVSVPSTNLFFDGTAESGATSISASGSIVFDIHQSDASSVPFEITERAMASLTSTAILEEIGIVEGNGDTPGGILKIHLGIVGVTEMLLDSSTFSTTDVIDFSTVTTLESFIPNAEGELFSDSLSFPDQSIENKCWPLDCLPVQSVTGIPDFVFPIEWTDDVEIPVTLKLTVNVAGDFLLLDGPIYAPSSSDFSQTVTITGFDVLDEGENPVDGASFTFVSTPDITEVQIDIKPGSDPNTINLGSNGNVPVAIFSTADFDATTIDPFSITLEDASVRLRGKSNNPQASSDDINLDGLLDLVVHIDTDGLDLTLGDVMATLAGSTLGGTAISGSDMVRVIDPNETLPVPEPTSAILLAVGLSAILGRARRRR